MKGTSNNGRTSRNRSTNLFEIKPENSKAKHDFELESNNHQKQKHCTHFMKILATAAFLIFWSINILGISPTHISGMAKKVKKLKSNIVSSSSSSKGPAGKVDSEFESVMRLGPPWNYMRDVVMELPVFDEDATFLWETRDSSGPIVKKMLKKCFDLPLDEADQNTAMSKYGRTEGISSLNIRMIAEKFTEQSRGRMFAFFRHPYYIHLSHTNKAAGDIVDNPMARMILDQPDGEIDFKGLGTAKKVIREKCVVGLMDTEYIDESIKRISSYFGWGTPGDSKSCTRIYRSEMKLDPKGELMNDATKSWEVFIKDNYVDLQLYEFARSVFRAQRQTIIPRDKQISITSDEEEKEEAT